MNEMTAEEAVKQIKENCYFASISEKTKQALEIAIKALEQQPCEDCISRQAVIEGLANIAKAKAKSDAQKSMMGRCMFFVEQLPPVIPQRPKGHNENNDYADCDQFVCSKCGIELQDWHRVERDEDDGYITYHEYEFRYCPNCGRRVKRNEADY